MTIIRVSVIAAAMCCATAAIAQGWQSRTVPATAAPPANAKPTPERVSAKPAAGRQAVQSPVGAQIEFLTRSALLTLNDANRSGNYTVLRDVAAPTFREGNSAADLAQIFAELRRARLDLGVAALMTPELEAQPQLDAERRLRVRGSYPTVPNRIAFDLMFEAVGGHWLLHGISISTRPAGTAAR
jgi:hypothetical protein